MKDFPSPISLTNDAGLRVIVINESIPRSIITDIVMFGCLAGAFWFNHEFMGDGIILQLVLAFCFFTVLIARSGEITRRMTPQEALAYFQKHYGTTK